MEVVYECGRCVAFAIDHREQTVDAIRDKLAEVYGLPPDYAKYRCKEGTNWSTNAPEKHFDPERVRSGGVNNENAKSIEDLIF
jgi:hypothetical protein